MQFLMSLSANRSFLTQHVPMTAVSTFRINNFLKVSVCKVTVLSKVYQPLRHENNYFVQIKVAKNERKSSLLLFLKPSFSDVHSSIKVLSNFLLMYIGCNKIIAPCTLYTKNGIFYFCNRSNR